MSSDHYFRKWKQTLVRLDQLLHLDIEYQENKIHDKKLYQAAERLSGILGEYIALYNDFLDCLQQNLQVQKTQYIADVVKAVAARILELKHQLSKLDNSNYQFLVNGLINHKLTTHDADFVDIPEKSKRAEHLTSVIEEVIKTAEEERERLEDVPYEEIEEVGKMWWVEEKEEKIKEIQEKVSEETLRRRKMVNLIKAHDKTRQVVTEMTHQKMKRVMWTKELQGTLQPQAREEIQKRAAKLIQDAFRYYFILKRKKITYWKRDELLDIKCKSQVMKQKIKLRRLTVRLARAKKYEVIENKWKGVYDEMKQKYFKNKAEDISDDFKDVIRNWFRQWLDEVQFFYDIPTEKQGGSSLILKEQVPMPSEWLEQYKAYIAKKKADKNKSSDQLKQEKLEAKREVMMLKKEQQFKEKQEANMLKKLMKNPTKHPGYHYPESKKTEIILKAVENYHKDWDDLDVDESPNVKQGTVKAKDIQQICMEVKLDLMKTVDEHMKQTLKELRKALKKDYEIHEAQMPEIMKQPGGKAKKKKKLKATSSIFFYEKLLKLAVKGFLKEYPKTKFEDFLGDPNFAGDDLRALCQPALPFNGETRNVWLERCRELIHGFHKILLVGARGSGKNTLIHAMATVNNALLFEIDPSQLLDKVSSSSDNLKQLVINMTSCARVAQPCIIHIRDIHRLFCAKVPLKNADLDINRLKSYLTKNLFKGIQKHDYITIIGTCVDPWMTKSKQMLKQFPTVVLMPNTSYSTTVQILKQWVMNNRAIPCDLDVHTLANVLQGYNFGYLKQALQNFLSADQIVKIAAKGLNPVEVFNFILQDENETKTDYERYLKWYQDKTKWGQRENKHAKQQIEFKQLLATYTEKAKQKVPAMDMQINVSSMQSVVPK